jgi:hypothetical protein
VLDIALLCCFEVEKGRETRQQNQTAATEATQKLATLLAIANGSHLLRLVNFAEDSSEYYKVFGYACLLYKHETCMAKCKFPFARSEIHCLETTLRNLHIYQPAGTNGNFPGDRFSLFYQYAGTYCERGYKWTLAGARRHSLVVSLQHMIL